MSAIDSARPAQMPEFIELQLATLKAPQGDQWLHEIDPAFFVMTSNTTISSCMASRDGGLGGERVIAVNPPNPSDVAKTPK